MYVCIVTFTCMHVRLCVRLYGYAYAVPLYVCMHVHACNRHMAYMPCLLIEESLKTDKKVIKTE